eukprot:6178783-Pleurochrysis_carterae.AAC.1
MTDGHAIAVVKARKTDCPMLMARLKTVQVKQGAQDRPLPVVKVKQTIATPRPPNPPFARW